MAEHPTPEDLAASGEFDLLGEMHNATLLQFVVDYFLRRRTWLVWTHHAMSICTAAAAIAVAVSQHRGVPRTLGAFFVAFAALVVFILPLHELAHAVAYRLAGARDIRWGFSVRMLAVWVTAHRFVARRRPFIAVALAPFVALNVPLVAAIVLFPGWRVLLLFVLLWHLHGASGDFAILNFIWIHRSRGFWTWDDCEAGVSYFYGRAESVPPPGGSAVRGLQSFVWRVLHRPVDLVADPRNA